MANKFTVNLTFGEVERVVAMLRKYRDSESYVLNDKADGYVKDREYDTETKEYRDIPPHVVDYQVRSAENFVEKHAEVSEVIAWFTGETETLPIEKLVALREARSRLDRETAEREAAAADDAS